MTTTNQSATENIAPAPGAAALAEESKNVFKTAPSVPATTNAVAAEETRAAYPDEKAAEAFATHVHSYIAEFIRLADQKSAFTLAACTGLLCYGFKINLHQMWMKAPKTFTALDLVCFVAMASLAFGFALSVWVIVPNLHKSHRGFVYFGSIAEYESAAAYASEILASPSTHLRRAILQHSYDIAKVCTTKYLWLRRSLWATTVGVVLFVAVLLMK